MKQTIILRKFLFDVKIKMARSSRWIFSRLKSSKQLVVAIVNNSAVAIVIDFLFSKKETGPELVVIYDFDERHLAGILANKADESLKEKLNLVDHLCENTF